MGSGQDIALADSSDCLPTGVEVAAVKYCSDSDTLKFTIKDKAVPIPVSAVLSKITCPAEVTNAATCKGTDDPAGPACYEGSAGALGLTETVKVQLLEVGAGEGKLAFTGSGIEGFTCSDKSYTKSGTDLTLSDISDCLPDHVEVTKVKYCSDNDQVQVTVKDDTVPLPITAKLNKIACASRDEVFASCTGSDDPVISEATCYQGKGGPLGLTETVTVKVNNYASGKGQLDFNGDGITAFTCAGKSFTKSGQDIALADSSDCLPTGVEVAAVKYCSESDSLKLTIKDKAVPIPVSAILSKTTCPSFSSAADIDCTKATCQKDCECSLEQCASEIDACLAAPNCAASQDCALACPCDNDACILKCAASSPSIKALPVAKCINSKCDSSSTV